jgi:meso-butanediol dehydrogenase/(S,S)-butanediol dehydrogenase/diacetyl reductase
MQKIAVVTGSYQGIGKGIADGLKASGYEVVYSDVHPAMDGEVYCKCDISKAEDREALAKFVLDKYGRILCSDCATKVSEEQSNETTDEGVL